MNNQPPPPNYDQVNKLPDDQPGVQNQSYTTSNQPPATAGNQSMYPPLPNPAYPPVQQPVYQQPTSYSTAYPQPIVGPHNTVAPQPGVMNRQPNASTNIIVTNQHPVMTSYIYRGFPMQLSCPYCHEQVTTELTYVNGGLTYMLCGLTALFGCWCGCCLIPFAIDGCKNVQHNCPNCKRVVGTYHRM